MNKEEDWKEISRKIIRSICLMETENKRQDVYSKIHANLSYGFHYMLIHL